MDVQVRDDPSARRFALTVDGEPAGEAVYRMRGDVVVIIHSEVDRRFRGHGLANELARQSLDELRERGAKVVPMCPFYAHYVAEHPEYDDIVLD
jgi:uncharacterized protein